MTPRGSETVHLPAIDAYQGGQGPLGWMAGATPAGVIVELVVKGTVSAAAGTRLKEFKPAHPQAAQRLGPSNQP